MYPETPAVSVYVIWLALSTVVFGASDGLLKPAVVPTESVEEPNVKLPGEAVSLQPSPSPLRSLRVIPSIAKVIASVWMLLVAVTEPLVGVCVPSIEVATISRAPAPIETLRFADSLAPANAPEVRAIPAIPASNRFTFFIFWMFLLRYYCYYYCCYPCGIWMTGFSDQLL